MIYYLIKLLDIIVFYINMQFIHSVINLIYLNFSRLQVLLIKGHFNNKPLNNFFILKDLL
jgi:hypothetical protein